MTDNNGGGLGCTLTCWLVGLLGGLLLAVLLMVMLDFSFIGGIFLGGVLGIIAGAALTWALCRPLPAAGEATIEAKVPGAPSAKEQEIARRSGAEASAPAVAASAAGAATAAASASAAAKVKPSKTLAGEAELAERSGDWKYEGDADAAAAKEAEAKKKAAAAKKKAAADAKKAEAAAAKEAAAAASGDKDYDGDGVVEGVNEGTRPEALDGPRGGKADDLKQIKGVGPKMEKLCNSLGFYHFDQIAGWTPDEVAWVDANLEGFKGRVTRDTWVAQAKILAEGGTTEFSKKVKKGGVY